MENEVFVADVVTLRMKLPADVQELTSDEECERFLRQRKSNINQACNQMVKRYDWYLSPFGKSLNCSHKPLTPADMLFYESPKENIFSTYGLNSFLGEDMEGNPVYWEKSGLAARHWPDIMHHVSEDEAIMRHVQHMEIMMEKCRVATERHGRLINQQTVVMDLVHFPLFPSLSKLLGFVRRVHEIDRYFYPETLKRVFLINTPSHWSFFYHMVTPFIGRNTFHKIIVLDSNFLETLEKHIDKNHIPVEYGGSCENFSWQWPTNLDIAIPTRPLKTLPTSSDTFESAAI